MSEVSPPALIPLPLGAIKPLGWLRDQLRIQANGLSGHLDEFWPSIADSKWVGGGSEGWERGAVLARRHHPAGRPAGRREAQGQGAALDRLHPSPPAPGRLAGCT